MVAKSTACSRGASWMLLGSVVLKVGLVTAELRNPYVVEVNSPQTFGDTVLVDGHEGLENYNATYLNGYLHISFTVTHHACCFASFPPHLLVTNGDPKNGYTADNILYQGLTPNVNGWDPQNAPTDWYRIDIQFSKTGYHAVTKTRGSVIWHETTTSIPSLQDDSWIALFNEYPISGCAADGANCRHSMAFEPMRVTPVTSTGFSGFVRPVEWGPYDGVAYPYYSTPYLGDHRNGSEGSGSHVGVDIIVDKNGRALTATTEVRAIYDGTIERRTNYKDDSQGWGNSLVLKHTGIPDADPAGVIYSVYAHLTSIANSQDLGHLGVRWNVGHRVKKGNLLGFVGDTDAAGALHLHFQLDKDYPDKLPCGAPPPSALHPFYPDRVPSHVDAADRDKEEEDIPDADHCVEEHTLHPVRFIENHLAQ